MGHGRGRLGKEGEELAREGRARGRGWRGEKGGERDGVAGLDQPREVDCMLDVSKEEACLWVSVE